MTEVRVRVFRATLSLGQKRGRPGACVNTDCRNRGELMIETFAACAFTERKSSAFPKTLPKRSAAPAP